MYISLKSHELLIIGQGQKLILRIPKIQNSQKIEAENSSLG